MVALSQTLAELVAILFDSATEVRSMFATKLKEHGERLKHVAFEEGRREGRLEGLREGRPRGVREGAEQARSQAARAMRDQGMDITVISDVTGLSAEAIECLWAEPVRTAKEIKGMFKARLREYEERLKDEGREEGRWDGRKESARAMKKRGIDTAVIAEVTGLLIEEIEALQAACGHATGERSPKTGGEGQYTLVRLEGPSEARGWSLATADPQRFRSYFPGVRLITPQECSGGGWATVWPAAPLRPR